MTLAEIEEGSAVFIDANVFIYHFVGASPQCTALLRRCETTEIQGSTSALVLAEVSHRLMMIEAVERKLVTAGNVVRKLVRRPDAVRQLIAPEANIQAIPAMGIEITAVTEATILLGLRHQRRYGLLTNDSLIVASMQQQGVRALATADRRLAIVDEIDILVPADLGAS
jgi:predicted nucleic acid-binding protein